METTSLPNLKCSPPVVRLIVIIIIFVFLIIISSVFGINLSTILENDLFNEAISEVSIFDYLKNDNLSSSYYRNLYVPCHDVIQLYITSTLFN